MEIKLLNDEDAIIQLHVWFYVFFSKLREFEAVVGRHIAWSSFRASVCLYDGPICLPVIHLLFLVQVWFLNSSKQVCWITLLFLRDADSEKSTMLSCSS